MIPRAQRGATTIEMTLVGIPLIFMLISTFEISRGMWMYNTAATAVREGVRFATVHGVNCVRLAPGVPNSCEVTANDIVKVIRAGAGNAVTNSQGTSLNYGPTGAGAAGLDEVNTLVTFTSLSGSFSCKLDGTSTGSCALRWPPDGDNGIKKSITISIKTPFSSALSMFWPGSTPVSFAVVNLWASSSDTVQF
ncbi:MAG: TadE family protein [Bryobacterales bacterium]|nr:TadE family protein [Bryobacterales bacterium]